MLFKSFKKTFLMFKITMIMTDTTPVIDSIRKKGYWKYMHELDEAFEKLFNHMMTMSGYYEILSSHNATSQDLSKIAWRIYLSGYEYYKRDFLPVYLVSFGDSLDYLLDNKESINNEVIEEAIIRLYKLK